MFAVVRSVSVRAMSAEDDAQVVRRGCARIGDGHPGGCLGSDPFGRRRQARLPQRAVRERAGGGRRGLARRRHRDLPRAPTRRGRQRFPAGGANAVSIAKMLTIRGAGASKVTIRPKPAITSLLGTTTNYRNTVGSVIGVYRAGVRTLVDISGVTVEGGLTTVGSAVKFYNAEGSLTGSVIRNVAPLNGALRLWRRDRVQPRRRPAARARRGHVDLRLRQGRRRAGLDAARARARASWRRRSPATRSPAPARRCRRRSRASSPPASSPGSITGNAITNNAGAGDRASAGVRLVDLDLVPAAGATTTKLTATGNNIVGNGYGVVNETGAGADAALPFTATGNWWGNVAGPSIGLPKTLGDPVNGAAVTFSGFRTTAIAAPVDAHRDHRRGADGGDRPADGEQDRRAGHDLHPARARRRRLRRALGRPSRSAGRRSAPTASRRTRSTGRRAPRSRARRCR